MAYSRTIITALMMLSLSMMMIMSAAVAVSAAASQSSPSSSSSPWHYHAMADHPLLASWRRYMDTRQSLQSSSSSSLHQTSSGGTNNTNNSSESDKVTDSACHIAAIQYDALTYPNAVAMQFASGHSTTDTGNYGNCWVIPAAHFCTASWVKLDSDVLHDNSTGYLVIVGLCVPINCTSDGIINDLPLLIDPSLTRSLSLLLDGTLSVSCTDERLPWQNSTMAMVIASICAFFVIMVTIATLWDVLRNHHWCRCGGDDEHDDHDGDGIAGHASMMDDDGDPDLLHEHKGGDTEIFQYADHATMVYDAAGTLGSNSSPSSSLRRMSPMIADRDHDHVGRHGVQMSSSYHRHRNVGPAAAAANLVVSTKKYPLYIRVLQAFSFPRNVNQLMAPLSRASVTGVGVGAQQSQHGGINLSSLNGIRVISMSWLILGHTMLYAYELCISQDYLDNAVARRFSFSLILQSPLGVDAFFLISGLLGSYFLLKVLFSTGSVNWMMYFLHRFLRLTPIYAFWLFVYWALSPHIGDGPIWFLYNVPGCDDYWWTNLLYINNFVPSSNNDGCMSWSWYLSNDFQFSLLLLPLLVYGYYISKGFGKILLLVMLCAALITTGTITATEGYTAGWFSHSDPTDYNNEIFGKPYVRAVPYLMGVLTAFYMDEYTQLHDNSHIPGVITAASGGSGAVGKGRGFNGSRSYASLAAFLHLPWWARKNRSGTCAAVTCALLSFVAMLAIIFLPYDINRHGPHTDYNWSDVANVAYLTFGRFVWSIGLAVWIFLFATGRGGWIRKVFTSSIWLPFARLTYQAYLVQGIWIIVVLYMRYTLVTYSDIEYAYMFLGNTIGSYVTAFIGYVLVEKPLQNIELLLFPTKHKSVAI